MSATTLSTANEINRKTDVFAHHLAETLASFPATILQLVLQELHTRQQIAHLRALPGYLLDDAGIDRADIERTVRGHRPAQGT